MTLIGVYGDSRCGKDSVANILVEHLGFEKRSLATPIREALLHMDPQIYTANQGYWNSKTYTLSEILTSCDNDWDRVKKLCPDVVDLMINLGQHMRTISPRIWLDACLAKPYNRLVIPDVRQPNEYDEIIRRGGVVWNVKRPGTVPRGMDRLLEDKHFDVTLYNNGTIEELTSFVIKCGTWRIHVSEADQKTAD